MRFHHHLLDLCLWATSVLAADYKTVHADIGQLTSLLDVLDQDAKAVAPGAAGLPRALQLEVDAVDIHKAILKATADTNASPSFGAIGSLTISADFLALSPKIKTSIGSLAAKQSALADLGLVVLSSLYQLKQDTNAFGDAVLPKLDALERAVAPLVISDINKALNNAIVTFGGKGK